jgi:hypothetical protein
MIDIQTKHLNNFIEGIKNWEDNVKRLMKQAEKEGASCYDFYETQHNVLKSIIDSLQANKLKRH